MRRALVLGGGGTTGIAWEAGVLEALAAGGVDVSDADVVIGTSAGALTGAMLTLGVSPADLTGTWLAHMKTIARVDARMVWRLARGQVAPDRAAMIRHYGRATEVASGLSQDAFVHAVAEHLLGRAWPERLVVTTVNAATGVPAVLDASSGVDLGLAVAASCAVPGVFPAVLIDGEPHLDGGVRTPANIDLAAGCDAVIALTPFHLARDRRRRPLTQLRALPPHVAWLYLRPDATAARVIGLDALDATRSNRAAAAGRRQGEAAASAGRRVWA